MTAYKLKDLDVFYISFDEANADVNWSRIKSMYPHAKRVHGVLGFDQAHKVCAMASNDRRFVTIDGDNWLNDGALDHEVIDDEMPKVCFSFKSINATNGLEYGNGGVKCWERESILSSTTHEKAESTDFCWDILYYQVNDILSSTVQNASAYQAWRAGYREGVKMSYVDGKPLSNFKTGWKSIWKGNLSRLCVWCTVGRDVPQGIWCIYGARLGLLELVTGAISHTQINDYDWFADRWDAEIKDHDPEYQAWQAAQKLLKDFAFYLPELDARHSKYFKENVFINPIRHGFMR